MTTDIISQIIDYKKRNISPGSGPINKEVIVEALGKASTSSDGYLSKEDYEKFNNLSGGNIETYNIYIDHTSWDDNDEYLYSNPDIKSTDFVEVFLLHSTNIENVVYAQETANFEKINYINTIDGGIEFEADSDIDIDLNIMIRRNIL